MAKFKAETHGVQKGEDKIVQHTQSFDDNLLPSGEEIAKLISYDPNILEWIKARATDEQKHRHEYMAKQQCMFDDSNKRMHNTARMGVLVFAGLLIICIGASIYLICQGYSLNGSLFGGTTIVLAMGVAIAQIRDNRKRGS
jgi:uncharacterized membrane protein